MINAFVSSSCTDDFLLKLQSFTASFGTALFLSLYLLIYDLICGDVNRKSFNSKRSAFLFCRNCCRFSFVSEIKLRCITDLVLFLISWLFQILIIRMHKTPQEQNSSKTDEKHFLWVVGVVVGLLTIRCVIQSVCNVGPLHYDKRDICPLENVGP